MKRMQMNCDGREPRALTSPPSSRNGCVVPINRRLKTDSKLSSDVGLFLLWESVYIRCSLLPLFASGFFDSAPLLGIHVEPAGDAPIQMNETVAFPGTRASEEREGEQQELPPGKEVMSRPPKTGKCILKRVLGFSNVPLGLTVENLDPGQTHWTEPC